jgi:DNA replication ATP-dependent helicase Dna2
MSRYRIFSDTPHLTDTTLARQLGQRLWTENDLQLDFSGIDSLSGEFAAELCRTMLQQRSAAVLSSALILNTMAPAVQTVFGHALSAALNDAPAPPPKSRPAARHCPACSRPVSPTAKFCGQCGRRLEQPTAPTPAVKPPPPKPDPIPTDIAEIVAALKQFVNVEQNTQNAQIREMWAKSIPARVAEGEAIAAVTVKVADFNRATLSFSENMSKFRELDSLILSRGDPEASDAYPCTVETDRGTEFEISPGFRSSFMGLSPGEGWVLDRAVVDVRRLLLGSLNELASETRQADITGILQGTISPRWDTGREQAVRRHAATTWGLNPAQSEAFGRTLTTGNFYLIQGPPGTGKTRVLAHLAAELAKQGQRVLVTALTHRAINNALRKIGQSTGYPHIIKIGKPHQAQDLVWENGRVSNFQKFSYSPYSPDQRGLIVGATAFATRTSRLSEVHFDTVLFDEAGQVTLPLAIAAMLAGDRYIFIGDHHQMAPIVVAEHSPNWVSRSVFETIFNHAPGTMLDTTYRMNADINRFPSERFYNGLLQSHPTAQKRRLELPRPPRQYRQLLDPAHPDVFAVVSHQRNGMRSEEEADVAAGVAAEAVACGLPAAEIAIVAPYRAQGRLIRGKLRALADQYQLDSLTDIVVDTVERIQGQERDLVIVSLTTSAPQHAADRAKFYFQPNRLNVAITRPRVKRIVIGNPVLFTATPAEPEMQAWVDHFRAMYEASHRVRV